MRECPRCGYGDPVDHWVQSISGLGPRVVLFVESANLSIEEIAVASVDDLLLTGSAQAKVDARYVGPGRLARLIAGARQALVPLVSGHSITRCGSSAGPHFRAEIHEAYKQWQAAR